MNLPLTLGACLAPGALGLLLLTSSAWRRFRPRGLALCPGPRPRLWQRLLLHRLLLIRACWYDLSGLPRGPLGFATCPECARRSQPKHALRSTRRWRPTTVALLLLALSTFLVNSSEARSWQWLRRLPTVALIPLAYIPAKFRPPHVSSELAERLSQGSPTPAETDALIPALIRDLRDDTVRWNGLTAIDSLRAIGPPALPALLAALDSPDWQQRQLAAHLLRSIRHFPTDALIRVTVEGLRDDALPYGPAQGGYGWAQCWIDNAQSGLRWLADNPNAIESHLAFGLESDDTQQRFLCAVAAGFTGRTRLLPRAAPILLHHLRDNDASGDASAASAALYRFGPPAIPFLFLPALRAQDPQQRAAARIIILDLLHPPITENQFALRRRLLRLTSRVNDPAVELEIDDLEW